MEISSTRVLLSLSSGGEVCYDNYDENDHCLDV